jgi:hypothetical protein
VAQFLQARAWWRLDSAGASASHAARSVVSLLDAAAYLGDVPDDDPDIVTLDAAGCFRGEAFDPGPEGALLVREWQLADVASAGPRDLLTGLARAALRTSSDNQTRAARRTSAGRRTSVPSRTSAGYKTRTEPPMTASGPESPVPDPSRLPIGSGSETGEPDSLAPTAGADPAQAATSVSSPLRNRWQRTPPVARPLAGYSCIGVTLTLSAAAPGRAPALPATVTTTAGE